MSSDVQPVRQQVPRPRVIPRPPVTATRAADGEPAAAGEVDRSRRVEQVRARLQSGALDQVEIYRATAQKMLARMLGGES